MIFLWILFALASLIIPVLSLYCKSCATRPRARGRESSREEHPQERPNITKNIFQPFHLIMTLVQFYFILHRKMDEGPILKDCPHHFMRMSICWLKQYDLDVSSVGYYTPQYRFYYDEYCTYLLSVHFSDFFGWDFGIRDK